MNRIFSDAKDLYVETTFVYLNATDDYIYWDKAFTKGVTMAEAVDLFFKGMTIVIDEGVFRTPIGLTKTDVRVKVNYLDKDGMNAAAMTIDSEDEV